MTSSVVGSINCPQNSGYKHERLENFEGTLVVSPPCSFSSTLFSLPTINTAVETVFVEPVKTIEQIHVNFVNETDIQTNHEVIALEKNIETLRNFSVERHRIVTQELEKIIDVTVTHSTAISFSVGIVLIIVVIIVCCFRYRSTVVPCLSFFRTSKSHTKSISNKNLQSVQEQLENVRSEVQQMRREVDVASPESQVTHLQADGDEAAEPLYDDLPDWVYEGPRERQPCTLTSPPCKPKKEMHFPPSIAHSAAAEAAALLLKRSDRTKKKMLPTRDVSPEKAESSYLRSKIKKALSGSGTLERIKE